MAQVDAPNIRTCSKGAMDLRGPWTAGESPFDHPLIKFIDWLMIDIWLFDRSGAFPVLAPLPTKSGGPIAGVDSQPSR